MKFARIFALLCLLLNLSFGASLLSYNFYSRDDYIDIMLNFNEAYNGQIRQQNVNGTTLLFLDGISTGEYITRNINSKILQNVSISNVRNSLQIELKSRFGLNVVASKSSDALGMRIRVNATNINAEPDFTSIGAQESNSMDSKYITVIVILGVLCAILLAVKRFIVIKQRKLNAQNGKAKQQAAEFSLENLIEEKIEKKQAKNEISQIAASFGLELEPNSSDYVKILFEKNLDEYNKLVLLRHEDRKYLVLVGNSNVMLDRFGEDKIADQNDFEAFFEENKQKLNKYLAARRNSLDDYKSKLDMN